MVSWGRDTRTPTICPTCKKLTDDEPGAYFGSGWMCKSCGYYRLHTPGTTEHNNSKK